MDDLARFLSTVGIVQGLELPEIRELAAVCLERRYRAGDRVLTQGARNSTLYFVRSGGLAVRLGHGRDQVTVAHLAPPAVVGEVSFATGRTCSADVDVVIDATLVALPLAALERLPAQRMHLLGGLMRVIAERLHTTMTRGVAAAPRPIVVLHRSRGWPPPRAFGIALASALAEEMEVETLVVGGGDGASADPRLLRPHVWHVSDGRGQTARSSAAEQLTSWTSRFGALVLDRPSDIALPLDVGPLATHHMWLLGPGEPPPTDLDPAHIVVQDAGGPALPELSARRRLVDLAGAERALADGAGFPAPLQVAVTALARGIAGRQIGLALGGGGAWGWAHIGVLDVLERAGVAIDAIAGCSMGSVVGGLRASGASIADLCAVADYWKRNHKKWTEYRFWRLHMANERRMQNAFRHMFGDRRLTTFATPFWANAIDIENAEEIVIKDGTLVDAVRGSMAFPGWTPPVRRNGRWLVDAAMIDPVPAALVKQMHCDRVIAVNTLGPMTPLKLESRLPKQAYDVLGRYMRIAAHEVGRIHGDVAADVTITPQVGETTMLSFNKSEDLIEAGRKAADECLALIREAARKKTN